MRNFSRKVAMCYPTDEFLEPEIEVMQEYVISMKNGHSFRVFIKDFSLFMANLQKAVESSQATNHLYSQGGVMFDISNISAIYPLSAQQNVEQTR
jgi:hypothetical protein